MIKNNFALICFSLIALNGCMNLATPPAEIVGIHVSTIKYDPFKCDRLTIELDSLRQREGNLVIAQNGRVDSAMVQAFWIGYGTGDGMAAMELATVRGEIQAVRKTMRKKGCTLPAIPQPVIKKETIKDDDWG